jgi:hypothetical protein
MARQAVSLFQFLAGRVDWRIGNAHLARYRKDARQ